MSRTPTLPPTDQKMWRKLIAASHPDRNGDHELCVWTQALRDHVLASGRRETPDAGPEPYPPGARRDQASSTDRVPFDRNANFVSLTQRAVAMADEVEAPYARLLRMLTDCQPSPMHEDQERRGASYKQLAAIGHAVEMVKRERVGWYRLCESIPLSDRHGGHILSRLKREAA
jgi:hypothetical protein